MVWLVITMMLVMVGLGLLEETGTAYVARRSFPPPSFVAS